MDESWEERLLGFDARVSVPSYWNDQRKGELLLRTDVVQPYSADPEAWPSLFDRPGNPRPGYVGFFQDLWEDVEQLQAHLAANCPKVPCAVVAITVHARTAGWNKGGSPLAPVLGGRVFDAFTGLPLPLPFARPSVRAESWSLLGFDVADVYGLSGLSSCAYPELQAIQQEELSRTFGKRLNARHLFDRVQDADDFRPICDARVPNHKPFFVYGLWRVDGGSSAGARPLAQPPAAE
ncbi:MAG TPA: hypothetical protein VGQ83_40385 [Polyangia bacterium]|jgi:hypothetical protein